jgi:hypothetical protein
MPKNEREIEANKPQYHHNGILVLSVLAFGRCMPGHLPKNSIYHIAANK